MRWLHLLCLLLLLFGGFGGCGRTPPPQPDLTPEEEAAYEKELRSRVEREGEGSSRRKEKDESGLP